MTEENQEEWEIEILLFIKGTEQAKAAICEVHAALLNYPLTYIDTKLSKPKLELQEVLKAIQDIKKAIAEGTMKCPECGENKFKPDGDLLKDELLMLHLIRAHGYVAVKPLQPIEHHASIN